MINKKHIHTILIANRYRIIRELGKGGMGIVYLVEDTLKGNRLEALKTIKKKIINENTIESFKKEFEVMARLRHPNLIQVYDFGFDENEDSYYITMEYVEGISLKDILQQKGTISGKKVFDIIISLCRTLEFIHSRGILHRDIKPGNIMLMKDKIKLMDFGLADLGKKDKAKTKGTLLYMSPEILKGDIDNKSDIFSLGITCYELITGKKFYENQQNIINLLRDKEKFIHYRDIAIEKVENPEIRKIITKIIKYDPQDRYQYASEIILAISKNLTKDYNLETMETKEAYILGAGFVGRKKELSKLKSHLGVKQNNKVLLVKGKAGIGKSRLYQEFKKYCQLQNVLFLEANCLGKISKTYSPFIDILNETLLNAPSQLIQSYGPELKKLLPFHKSLSAIKVNPIQAPKVEKGILIQNITNYILDYSKENKTKIAIYFNDIHWSDEGSLEVLQELMYKLSNIENLLSFKNLTGLETGLSIFASVREEEIDKIETSLKQLKNKKRLEVIELHPFDIIDVTSYLEAIFGDNYIDSSLKNEIPEINRKVGGNPFFLQQLLKSLVEQGLINRDLLKWELIRPIKEIEVPEELKDILKIRIEKLGFNCDEKKVLQFFALINKPICIEDFKKILPKEIDINIENMLINIERLELLSSECKEDKIKYNLAHSLIREVIEKEIDDKNKMHHHIAQRIEDIYRENIDEYLDELAYHYSQTDDKEKAIHYLEKAGDKAEESYANEKAIDYYDKLLLNLQGFKNLEGLTNLQ
ncbi:MAG: hypothetical protein DRJ01_11550, partial [Bacteroidetes bacterium]